MHVISKKKLREFWSRFPDARVPLEAWYHVTRNAQWNRFSDVRRALNAVDRVGRFFVFNIGGNKYRLVAAIHFNRGKVFIRHVMTHAEYDTGKWKSG